MDQPRYLLVALRRFRWQGRLIKPGDALLVTDSDALAQAMHFVRVKLARPADSETRRDVGLALALQAVIPRA